MLCAIGLLGGIAQMFQTGAARHAEVATITPFKYTALLWAILYGYLIWGEVPDGWTLVGAAIVAGSGLFIVLREAHLKPDRAQTASAAGPCGRAGSAKTQEALASMSKPDHRDLLANLPAETRKQPGCRNQIGPGLWCGLPYILRAILRWCDVARSYTQLPGWPLLAARCRGCS